MCKPSTTIAAASPGRFQNVISLRNIKLQSSLAMNVHHRGRSISEHLLEERETFVTFLPNIPVNHCNLDIVVPRGVEKSSLSHPVNSRTTFLTLGREEIASQQQSSMNGTSRFSSGMPATSKLSHISLSQFVSSKSTSKLEHPKKSFSNDRTVLCHWSVRSSSRIATRYAAQPHRGKKRSATDCRITSMWYKLIGPHHICTIAHIRYIMSAFLEPAKTEERPAFFHWRIASRFGCRCCSHRSIGKSVRPR